MFEAELGEFSFDCRCFVAMRGWQGGYALRCPPIKKKPRVAAKPFNENQIKNGNSISMNNQLS